MTRLGASAKNHLENTGGRVGLEVRRGREVWRDRGAP